FVPGPNHNFLNSTFSNNEKHIKLEKEPKLHLNIKDAEEKGIENGDLVKVWNDCGSCIRPQSLADGHARKDVFSDGS
ncbi:molybdopterin oxidoreductase family protein, partial [Klebsiella oxytoca]